MERLYIINRRQMTRVWLMSVLGVIMAGIALPVSAGESAVQKELNRRLGNVSKAGELLKSGDIAYQKKDYKSAVQDYAQAFELLPMGAMNHELRATAAERYATAATERSRALAKGGSYDEARKLLDTVLMPQVSPGHRGALKLRAQVDDPIRYNHAITPEHVQDVVKVGRLLREAEGFYSLGQYDRALTVYSEIINVDPFNKAARRGMERINVAQSDYYRAARDHTRAEMLSEVDKGWELFVPVAESVLAPSSLADPSFLAPDLASKLAGIVIDVIDLEQASLEEALDFVRAQSRAGDVPDAAGEQPGVNIILNLGDNNSDAAKAVNATRVNLKARELPLSKILDYITDQTRTQWRADGVGILVTPIGGTDDALISKTFRVPPNFLQSLVINNKDDSDDVFGDDDSNEGKLAKRISITDFLKQSGVSFPAGASASYAASTNSLIVRNTMGNIDLIDQLVSLMTDEEPVLVVIKTTIMRISEERLKELNFDWLISPVGLGGGLTLGGGTTGNGTAFGNTTSANPITAGIRSGDGAASADAIDAFLFSSNTGIANDTTSRAPGILAVTGVFNGVQIQMLMRGLDQKTGADVMVKPSTISRSGERSKVEIIREFIYPTEYEPAEVPGTFQTSSTSIIDLITGEVASASSNPGTLVTPANPTAFETRNVGVTLEVEPTVGPDKKFIELSLRPEMVEFEGFVNYGSPINGVSATSVSINIAAEELSDVFSITGGTFGRITDSRILMPIFKTIRLQNSTLTIQDGATVVLGGVMTSRKTKVEDKVPFLGDIPYAGRLFRSDASRIFREAVIVMVNAELVDPTGEPWRKR